MILDYLCMSQTPSSLQKCYPGLCYVLKHCFSQYIFQDSFNIPIISSVYVFFHEIHHLVAILKNGSGFRKVLYTVDVGLSRAFQRYITCPASPTRSEVRRGRDLWCYDFYPIAHAKKNVKKNFVKSFVSKVFYDPSIITNGVIMIFNNHHAKPADGQLLMHYSSLRTQSWNYIWLEPIL